MESKKERASDDFIGIDIDIEPPPTNKSKSKQTQNSKTKTGPGASKSHNKQSRPSSFSYAAAITATSISNKRKRPRKPEPPPLPPQSLVSLLKNDVSVRSYFQSLQANLDYDVEKWKFEAAQWKHIATNTSTAKVASGGSTHRKNGTSSRKKRLKQPAKKKGMGKRTKEYGASKDVKQTIQSNQQQDDEEIPITDDVLFEDLSNGSSDSSDSHDSVQSEKQHGKSSIIDRQSELEFASTLFETNKRRVYILNKLKEAKKFLELLGVSLAEVEVKTTVSSSIENDNLMNTDEADGKKSPLENGDDLKAAANEGGSTNQAATKTTVERILNRQSDEKVAAEMMASLKTLIKTSEHVVDQDGGTPANGPLQLTNEELMHRRDLRRRYHPFYRDGQLHTPNVYYSINTGNSTTDADEQCETMSSEHPASVGLKYLINILSIMNMYCGDYIEDDEWNAIFVSDNNENTLDSAKEMAILQIGMRNRCHLTERVLSSLDVEITRMWAMIDRASNLVTPTLHFHPADALNMDDPENTNIHNQFYDEKSYQRLANLAEAISHARIATLLHRCFGNVQKAAELVVGYVISSVPSLGVEQHPKLPPVLSMCILEALLAPIDYIPKNAEVGETAVDDDNASDSGWFRQCIHGLFGTADTTLLKALAYPIHISINVLKQRQTAAEHRIREIASVELAAFERIQKLDDGTWLPNSTFQMLDIDHILSNLNIDDDIGDTSDIDANQIQTACGIACTATLLTLGDAERVIELCKNIAVSVNCHAKEGKLKHGNQFLLPVCCTAYTSIMSRKWESMKLGNTSGRHTAAAFTIEDRFSHLLESVMQHIKPDDWQTINIITQCCVHLGDGGRLQRLVNRMIPSLIQQAGMPNQRRALTTTQRIITSRTLSCFVHASEIPTVRVINLRRRPDRMLDFMACAVRTQQLIVIKGPTKLRVKVKSKANAAIISAEAKECTDGEYAFDGQCNSENDLEKQLLQRLYGKKGTLSDFVKAQWRPSELKAFDRDARDDFKLVNTSITEKACTLSHIASWMGVESTLSDVGSNSCRTGLGHEWYQKKLIRMFKISGFAKGPPLLHENEGMEPVPVCVILEDDAALNDRFAERLESLLDELPRDFHFCSLGYSRPKSAPIVEYSSHVGIPSFLWYLTGYVLSLEGARYLIQSLPAVGPVDSWIGLKMVSNWDNKFGDNLNVGKKLMSKEKLALPSRKDLTNIMKFRAFAALVPLCAQKTLSSGQGSWRDRDSDITYSGDKDS